MMLLAFLLSVAQPPEVRTETPVRTRFVAALRLSAVSLPPSCITNKIGTRIEAARALLRRLSADYYQRETKRGEWPPPPIVPVMEYPCGTASAYAAEFEAVVEDFRSALAGY